MADLIQNLLTAQAQQRQEPIPKADLQALRDETRVMPSVAGLPRIIRAFVPAT